MAIGACPKDPTTANVLYDPELKWPINGSWLAVALATPRRSKGLSAETLLPSDSGPGRGAVARAVFANNVKVGDIWCQMALPACFRSPRASCNNPWSSDRRAAFARRRVRAAGSGTRPRGQPRSARTNHSPVRPTKKGFVGRLAIEAASFARFWGPDHRPG
jgi:hypothetical protein